MKTDVLDLNGKKLKDINVPSCFLQKIREDIILKVLETKKTKQPYAPSPVAGKQHSASGIIHRKRHSWKISYGRGISRVPRKIMSRRGSQFNWVGAEIAGNTGGRRAHPPKILSIVKTKKINKKEMRTALISALSATANEKEIRKKYPSLKDKKLRNVPIIAESKITSLNTKKLLESLKKILEGAFEIAIKKKDIRSGKGKFRGRKYKESSGALLVTGQNEKIKTNLIDSVNTKNLSVIDLAKGGQGRLTIYTENAIKDLADKLK